MTQDFKKTATPKGAVQRQSVAAAVKSLQAVAATSPHANERINAKLQLERLGISWQAEEGQ